MMRIRVATYPDQITGKPRQSTRVALIRDGTAPAGGRKRPVTIATMDRWSRAIPAEVAAVLEPAELEQLTRWMQERDQQVAAIVRELHLDHAAEHIVAAAEALDAGNAAPSFQTIWEGVSVLEAALGRAGHQRPDLPKVMKGPEVREEAIRQSGPSPFIPENLAELLERSRTRTKRTPAKKRQRPEPSTTEAGRILRGRMGRKVTGFAQWLEPLAELSLGAGELSQVISAVLSRDGIPHVVQTGRLLIAKVGTVPRHTWVALLASGSICDFRAQARLNEIEGVPHGVFTPEPSQRYTATGELQPMDAATFLERTGIALQTYPPSASYA